MFGLLSSIFSSVACIDSGNYDDGSARRAVRGISASTGSVLHSWNVCYTREVIYRNTTRFVTCAFVYFAVTLLLISSFSLWVKKRADLVVGRTWAIFEQFSKYFQCSTRWQTKWTARHISHCSLTVSVYYLVKSECQQ